MDGRGALSPQRGKEAGDLSPEALLTVLVGSKRMHSVALLRQLVAALRIGMSCSETDNYLINSKVISVWMGVQRCTPSTGLIPVIRVMPDRSGKEACSEPPFRRGT